MIRRIFGFIYCTWAMIFSWIETNYFGRNWTPQSPMEWYCDITCALLSIAGCMLLFGKKNKFTHTINTKYYGN